MPVPSEVRQVEAEIDREIAALDVWKRTRGSVLRQIVNAYRDCIEVIFAKHVHAKTFDLVDEKPSLYAWEDRLRSGVLWALKWAIEYCPKSGKAWIPDPNELLGVTKLGEVYETFVDTLKYANHGLIAVEADMKARTVICYEGGNITPYDLEIVQEARKQDPESVHAMLTGDEDQLTSRWTAGDYRRTVQGLAADAASKENTMLVDEEFLRQIGKEQIPIGQPTVVTLGPPTDTAEQAAFCDLTLPDPLGKADKWQIVSFLDNPIVCINQKSRALSSDLKSLAVSDDHMLRLAARIDPQQYSLVSGLREARMTQLCKTAFEKQTWRVRTNVLLKEPKQEVDFLALRSGERIGCELKSTLRPETPWEVYKRNEDILHGIEQARRLIDRGEADRAFLVTDGYSGDYTCWKAALENDITIATVFEVDSIAQDPAGAAAHIQKGVGIGRSPTTDNVLPDREADLCGWKIRWTDVPAPQERR